jgi:serine beta-lactamase-like protein LACTB
MLRPPARRMCVVAWSLLILAPEGRGAALPVDKEREIRTAIVTSMARQTIPGLSAAIAMGGDVSWTEGFGLADVENQVPATADTAYRLASISKPITAVAVIQLVERGEIDLDAPVQRYVPGFPAKAWPITTRQLLGHLGGIRHYGSTAEVGSTRHYPDLRTSLDIFKDDPLLFEPGIKFHYTTYGYNLLGCVVEGAAGETYLKYVNRRIFRPAKMERIRDDDLFALIPHRAQGYTLAPDGTLRNSALADTSNKIPGGGFIATAADLARFAVAVQDGTLVRPETRDAMFTPLRLKDGTPSDYGLGWRIREVSGRKSVEHGGAQQRVSTFLLLLPSDGLAVSLMCNRERVADLPRLARRIASIALGEAVEQGTEVVPAGAR